MKNIYALVPLVIILVALYYIFQLSPIIVAILILASIIIYLIKIFISSSYRDYEAIKLRTCYKCGSKMVLRTAQDGKYKGKKFYGCTNYPKCDCLIDINGKPISLFYRKYRKVKKQISRKTVNLKCDKCGSDMVLRTAKQGKYKGKKFYGCSNFHNCKNIVNIV